MTASPFPERPSEKQHFLFILCPYSSVAWSLAIPFAAAVLVLPIALEWVIHFMLIFKHLQFCTSLVQK